MRTYENFAGVYDELMDDVPYEQWADRLCRILASYGITGGLMLELGCGTGKMMALMAKRGFDMIGVDSSTDMLHIAGERTRKLPGSFLYLMQDMREFELYGTVAAVISVCDSLNYITEPEELEKVFRLVNNYLDPGGLFLFDFNTEYKYKEVIGDTIIAEDREEVSFIWYNEYDEREHINYIDLSLFVKEKGELYRKFREEHMQRGYQLSEIKELLHKAGLHFLEAFDGYTGQKAVENSERILVAACEKGKIRQNDGIMK